MSARKCGNDVLSPVKTVPKKFGNAAADATWQQHEWGVMRESPRAFRGWSIKPSSSNESRNRDSVVGWGVFLFIFSIFCLVCLLLAVALPFLLMDGVDAEADRIFLENWIYYCTLVPLTVPVALTSVYLHWVGMKLFKHA